MVNYRDHKPQDNTYVYKFNPFTSDIADVQKYLKGLTGELASERRSCADSQRRAVATVQRLSRPAWPRA